MATKKKPVTLHHPTFPDLAVTVSAEDLADWLASGWLEAAPKAADEQPHTRKVIPCPTPRM